MIIEFSNFNLNLKLLYTVIVDLFTFKSPGGREHSRAYETAGPER